MYSNSVAGSWRACRSKTLFTPNLRCGHAEILVESINLCWLSRLMVTLKPACCRISTPSSCKTCKSAKWDELEGHTDITDFIRDVGMSLTPSYLHLPNSPTRQECGTKSLCSIAIQACRSASRTPSLVPCPQNTSVLQMQVGQHQFATNPASPACKPSL